MIFYRKLLIYDFVISYCYFDSIPSEEEIDENKKSTTRALRAAGREEGGARGGYMAQATVARAEADCSRELSAFPEVDGKKAKADRTGVRASR